MKWLLTALLGLSSIGGTLAPTIVSLNSANNLQIAEEVSPQASTVVNLGQTYEIVTENSGKRLAINFDWNWSNGGPNKIAFSSAMQIYVAWGDSHWENKFGSFNIAPNENGEEDKLFFESHNDFLARQDTIITGNLYKTSSSRAQFHLNFSTLAYNSFSTAWGKATVGPYVTFSN